MASADIEQALSTLEDGNSRLLAVLERLNPDDLVATGIGGGEWSPKDLFAHMALWQEIALRTLDECAVGITPWIVGVFATGGSTLNDDELAARAPWPIERAREAYESSFELVVRAFRGTAASAWKAQIPGTEPERDTVGGLLGAVLGFNDIAFGHAYAHLDDLEAFVRERRGSVADG